MQNLLKKIILKTVLDKNRENNYSPFEWAKAFRELKITLLNWVKDFVFILLGIGSAAFALESFLLPNSFIDGGATGISLLLSEITHVPLYAFLLLINIPFIF